METILVLTHVDETGSALTKASLEAVSAGVELARQLSATLTIGILGSSDAQAAAGAVAATGARSACCLGRGLCAAALRHRRRGMRGLVPRGAGQHRSGARQFALCARCRRSGASAGRISRHAYHSSFQQRRLEATRWFYRQRVEATISREARPWFLLLDAGTHAAFAGESGAAQVEAVAVTLPATRTTVEGLRSPMRDAQTIRPDARCSLSPGLAGPRSSPTDRSTSPRPAN